MAGRQTDSIRLVRMVSTIGGQTMARAPNRLHPACPDGEYDWGPDGVARAVWYFQPGRQSGSPSGQAGWGPGTGVAEHSGRQSGSPSGQAGWGPDTGVAEHSGRQSGSPSGQAGWSPGAGVADALAVNPVHHPGKPDGVLAWVWPSALAVNPVHHPGKPDGVLAWVWPSALAVNPGKPDGAAAPPTTSDTASVWLIFNANINNSCAVIRRPPWPPFGATGRLSGPDRSRCRIGSPS